MGWAIEALANVFLEILNDVMRFMMAVIQGITFDNAESFHTLTESVFPGLAGFSLIFRYLAWGVLTLIALFKMLQVIFDPEGRAEHPASILGRVTVAGVGITLSYGLIATFIKYMSKLYAVFYAQMENSIEGGIEGMIGTTSVFKMFGTDLIDKYQWGEGIGLAILMAMIGITMTTYFFMVIMEFLQRYVVIDVMFVTSPLAFATIGSRDTNQIFKKWLSAFFTNFLVMFLILVILGSFIGGFQYIASGEHYLDTLDKYPNATAKTRDALYSVKLDESGNAITNPVAEGYTHVGTSEEGEIWEDSNGNRIVIKTNGSGQSTGVARNAPRFIFHDGKDFAYSMLLLLAIVIMGTKIDQYIRDLGLTVFQTGEGMGRALMGSAMILREGIRSVSAGIRGGTNLVKGMRGESASGAMGALGSSLRSGGESAVGGAKAAMNPVQNGKRMLDGKAPVAQSGRSVVNAVNSNGQARDLAKEAIGDAGIQKVERQEGFHSPSYRLTNDGRSLEVTGRDGQKMNIANANYGKENPDAVGLPLENGYYSYVPKEQANSRLESTLGKEGIDVKPIPGINEQGNIEDTAIYTGTYKDQPKVFTTRPIEEVTPERTIEDPFSKQVVGYQYGTDRSVPEDSEYLLRKAGYTPALESSSRNESSQQIIDGWRKKK